MSGKSRNLFLFPVGLTSVHCFAVTALPMDTGVNG